jgi:Fe-Mn family superoxide dismutase
MATQADVLSKAVEIGADGKATYILPDLPYAKTGLEPVLSATLLEFHHDKHHKAYVDGLNKALATIDEALKSGDAASVRALCDAVAFNYGGHLLHTLYWYGMNPSGAREPKGNLAQLIERDFGSFEALKKWFAAAAVAVQGSGWAVLGWDPVGKRLMVLQTEQHHKALGWDMVPLLVIDVWEHAYYLDYQNKRADYVAKVMDILDWDFAGSRLEAAAHA